ncbi:WD40/YVTN/BNR-like repeat-containing protein [Urbifossiella limnaea]|uniref:BNR/Asp-box repeat protein n=1 Tax=Urbifossiella limnaea TaxID=2528023 RepID=A0A517Y263_9BACT|nr:hypothetical protein [Urbifossiella limnaea]QDU23788.1 BNR/Asp-box repeat protein [Urbifossiella limnaea]
MRAILIAVGVVLAAPADAPAEWRPLTTELLAREKTGFGGLCGVVVERSTGRLFVDLSDRGLFTSADRGATWTRVENSPPKGRTETPGCLQLDPTGKTPRLLMPLVYGSPIAVGTTGSGPWRVLDKASAHVDWCAADWSDPDLKFLLALKHEANGLLLRSRDGGKTFDDLGKGHGPAWVFDANTAVVTRVKTKDNPTGGVVRTTDGGATFAPVADFTPTALPRVGPDGVYWLADGGLHKTTDAGKTWAKVGPVKDGRYGPVFGKGAAQLFVLTGTGVVESGDGGKTWAAPVAVPAALKGVSALTWLDYDPTSDTLYLMKMGSELYARRRGE